jgi:hypothetical protein
MLVLKDLPSVSRMADSSLRDLLTARARELQPYLDGDDLSELVTFLVVEPGDSLTAIDALLGFQLLGDEIRRFELITDHSAWYEIVFILSDDGAGIEVLVPKNIAIDPQLLRMCADHALPLPD